MGGRAGGEVPTCNSGHTVRKPSPRGAVRLLPQLTSVSSVYVCARSKEKIEIERECKEWRETGTGGRACVCVREKIEQQQQDNGKGERVKGVRGEIMRERGGVGGEGEGEGEGERRQRKRPRACARTREIDTRARILLLK